MGSFLTQMGRVSLLTPGWNPARPSGPAPFSGAPGGPCPRVPGAATGRSQPNGVRARLWPAPNSSRDPRRRALPSHTPEPATAEGSRSPHRWTRPSPATATATATALRERALRAAALLPATAHAPAEGAGTARAAHARGPRHGRAAMGAPSRAAPGAGTGRETISPRAAGSKAGASARHHLRPPRTTAAWSGNARPPPPWPTLTLQLEL